MYYSSFRNLPYRYIAAYGVGDGFISDSTDELVCNCDDRNIGRLIGMVCGMSEELKKLQDTLQEKEVEIKRLNRELLRKSI